MAHLARRMTDFRAAHPGVRFHVASATADTIQANRRVLFIFRKVRQ